MTILRAPHISEKSARVGESDNQYVFKVAKAASKPEIKQAVELMFNVKVDDVRVVNVRGKAKRVGAMVGSRNSWKKAYVTLQDGQSINFMGPE